MGTKDRSRTLKRAFTLINLFILISILSLSLYFFVKSIDVEAYSHAPNYENVTVDTRLNVTNSAPEILSVVINNGQPVVLNAGRNTSVIANVTVRDWDNNYSAGFNDSIAVNGTFYYYLNKSTDPDDPNVHYTDPNCVYGGYIDDYTGYYYCNFSVRYFANNGTWYANVTVRDSYPNHIDKAYNTTTIQPIYALNVSTTVIDYGDVAVGDTSAHQQVNVTNIGNMAINITVSGYGNTWGDGLAMVCDIGNLTINDEEFSADNTTFQALVSGTWALVPQTTIPKQTQEGVLQINDTYWRITVPVSENPHGICTGYVVFSAIAP